MNYILIKKCQICNKDLKKFINLNKQPLCDDLLKKPNKNIFYKLKVKICTNCLTAFQVYNINKSRLFPKKYHYRSANTKDVLLGMKDLVNKIEKKKNLKNRTVLDIGCNDGSLLDIFKKKGAVTFGIEPTNAYLEAEKKGHKVYNKYFNLNLSKILKKRLKKIDIITFTNVFAHIEDFKDLIESLKKLISKETLIVIENHYLKEVLKKNQFDTFYHEHPRTYSLKSFYEVAKLLKVKITDFNYVKRYNGNIRVFLNMAKKNNSKLEKNLKLEKKIIIKYKLLQKKIEKWKKNKKKELINIVKKNGPLPAKAFPGRASILINLLELNDGIISNIYEKDSSLKINHYAPGTNIKILKERLLKDKNIKNGVMINFAWHISKEIKNYVKKQLNFNGKIVDIISKKDFK